MQWASSKDDVTSLLDTTLGQVVIPRVEIGGSVAEKDALEGGTVT
jgi:hypothetical protein